ncbi:Autophagy protein Atg8 ubiquitin like [Popillia japonica]|uniref:Autophagy protein Atg8 ubiquitin like n=1 Tax=Popillia japonica TaxID=7064 RepID=A0AAW1MNG7_POPJA
MFSRGTFISSLCNCKENDRTNICTFKTAVAKTIDMNKNKHDINANINEKKDPKRNKPYEIRKEEVLAIRNRFPTKIPIIVQRFSKETNLPQLDKTKFLVPQELTMSQFVTIIRNRTHIKSTQSLYLLVNNRSLNTIPIPLSQQPISYGFLYITYAEVYSEHAGVDGFLYITYASQETFGDCMRQHLIGKKDPRTLRKNPIK